jgi:hypothetical protein
VGQLLGHGARDRVVLHPDDIEGGPGVEPVVEQERRRAQYLGGDARRLHELPAAIEIVERRGTIGPNGRSGVTTKTRPSASARTGVR